MPETRVRACGLTMLWGLLLLATSLSPAAAAGRKSPLVAVDVGHSLAQPGATSARGATEFSFNVQLALAMQKAIERERLKSLVVNLDGRASSLIERTQKAKHAKFFLSVHHDSVQPQFLKDWEWGGRKLSRSEGFRGFSLFVSRSNPFPADSLACASTVGRALKRAGFFPSQYHAQQILGEQKAFADKENGVHFYDGLAVLRASRSPAVLLEAGVITDRDEESELAKPKVKKAIAVAVARGLRRCLRRGRHRQPNLAAKTGKGAWPAMERRIATAPCGVEGYPRSSWLLRLRVREADA